MKIAITPDPQKANSLTTMALMTLERLNATDKLKYPANTVTDYYDVIHKLLEALALLKGTKTKGEGAHQELIDYICADENLSEQTRLQIQQLREYRNRIQYEGFTIHINYIMLQEAGIKTTIELLLQKVKSKGATR
jgi:hypothetical protein